MRNVKDDNNSRLFRREESPKTKLRDSFPALPQREGDVVTRTLILMMPTQRRRKKKERSSLLTLATIVKELNPQHPSCYDTTDLCKCVKEDRLQKFNATMLKTILLHFDVAFNSKNRKKDLLQKLSYFVQECKCFLSAQ